jgi:hypothetical protein
LLRRVAWLRAAIQPKANSLVRVLAELLWTFGLSELTGANHWNPQRFAFVDG